MNRGRCRWMSSEDEILRQNYNTLGAAECARLLHRSHRSVSLHAMVIGVAAKFGSPEWKAKLFRNPKGVRFCPKGEFKKGHVPWTKGKRGIRLSPATEFKKGMLRGRAAQLYAKLGTVRIRNDKSGRQFRWIKVSHVGPPQNRWIPLARHLWITTQGPIKRGWFVIHFDGDTLNDTSPTSDWSPTVATSRPSASATRRFPPEPAPPQALPRRSDGSTIEPRRRFAVPTTSG